VLLSLMGIILFQAVVIVEQVFSLGGRYREAGF